MEEEKENENEEFKMAEVINGRHTKRSIGIFCTASICTGNTGTG